MLGRLLNVFRTPGARVVDLADPEADGPPILDEVSAEGVELISDAWLKELRAPTDEVLRTHGRGDPTFYERLGRDDQVYATFRRRRASVIAREIRVEPGGEQPIDREAADHLAEQLKRISYDRTCFKMLNGLMAGYGIGECMFQIPAGSTFVELESIRVRRSGRFRFRNDGTLMLSTTKDPTGVPMPPRKFWVFSSGAEDDDDPYGRGLGHYLYWPVWFKRNAWRFWATFLERFSQPLPKAVVPAGSTEQERRKLLDLLGNFIAGGKIVIPRGVDLELIQSMKDSGGDYERFVNMLNASIAKIVVTTTMTTDDGASLAQGQVHERGELSIVRSDSALLDESFTMGPARWLTEWNFPGAATPQVFRDFSEAEDLAQRADRDVKLSQIGFRLKPEKFAEIYGDGYEYSPPAAAAPAPDTTGGTGLDQTTTPIVPSFAELVRDASQAAADLMANGAWREVMGPEVDDIDKLLQDAVSLAEVRDRLGELARSNPERLTGMLARILFAGRVSGQEDADVPPLRF